MAASTALATLTRRLRRDHAPHRLHRWGTVTATTIDGVVAEIAVEYVIRFEAPAEPREVPTEDLESMVADAVEHLARERIARSTAADLPAAGDRAEWAERVGVPDVAVEHAVVVRSDVQVTPELRRLVGRREDRPGPWVRT